MSYCTNCGTTVTEAHRFCSNCGQPVSPQATSRTTTGTSPAPDSDKTSNHVTLNSLVESESVLCAPIFEDDLPGILYWVGEEPLPVNGPTGFAALSSGGNSDTIMVSCWDRRPQKMIPTKDTGMFWIRKKGGKWVIG